MTETPKRRKFSYLTPAPRKEIAETAAAKRWLRVCKDHEQRRLFVFSGHQSDAS
jgi:hypothetical protein